jgi:hypothetical protein
MALGGRGGGEGSGSMIAGVMVSEIGAKRGAGGAEVNPMFPKIRRTF